MHDNRGGVAIPTRFPMVALELPAWVEELDLRNREHPTQEERMRLAVEPLRLDAKRGTDGPFGAALFDPSTNRQVAPGINLMVSSNCSVAHAEMTAIMIDQQAAGEFDDERSFLSGLPPSKGAASTQRGSMSSPCCGRIHEARQATREETR